MPRWIIHAVRTNQRGGRRGLRFDAVDTEPSIARVSRRSSAVRQVAVLHLPGVVEHVVGAVSEQELHCPGSRRGPASVMVAYGGNHRLSVSAKLVAVVARL